MLWYKSWLETRGRFLIGLALFLCSAVGVVFAYHQVANLISSVPLAPKGELGRQVRESVALAQTFRGYVWSQWFRQNGLQMGTVFAVLLGTGGLMAPSQGALFTLSLPVSRNRLLAIRTALGLGELLVLSVVPSVLLAVLSPVVGQTYSFGDALVHAVCIFVAGSVFFSLAALLSVEFTDAWRPLMLSLGAALALGACGLVPNLARYSIFHVMSAEDYFRTGDLPWIGLLICVAASVAMLYGAALQLARHDF